MKKTFILLCALFALVACATEAIDETTEVAQNGQTIKLALTINRADVFADDPGTKATVKATWADGDVVFVFFQGVSTPKYMELKYDGSARTWTSTQKNDLVASDLGSSGTMTAVYLPYGSSTTVTAEVKGRFTFDPPYSGVFLQASQVPYTYDSAGLKGTLNLAALPLDNGKYVHFDISGYDATHTYSLYQDYVAPIQIDGVDADDMGTVASVGNPSYSIPGYIDAANGIVSFSGVLDDSAVSQALDYQFSINDETASVLYTRDAGTKTVSKAMYIGIGDISSSTTWNATEYVDLGISSGGKKYYWATKNLGATTESGEGSFGDFYAWSETTGYSLSGTFKSYSSSHAFSEDPVFETDPWGQLPIGNDPAHAALGGLWRTPTWEEFNLLSSNTTSQFDRAMPTVTTEYVDMGNYVGWAKYNVGASSVYEWGNLYAWGETAPKSSTTSKCYTESNYRGDHTTDPATALWGAPWRAPTAEELELLFNGSTGYYRCTWKTNMYGISGFNGWEVMADVGAPVRYGTEIEFPAAGEGNDKYEYNNGYIYYGNDNPQYRGSWGRYWTSTLSTTYDNRHMMLMFNQTLVVTPTTDYPDWYGFSVRPVIDLGSAAAGATFTSKKNSKTLFLPAAGYVESDNPQLQGFKALYWASNRVNSTELIENKLSTCYTISSYFGATTGEKHALKDGLPIRPVFTLPAD